MSPKNLKLFVTLLGLFSVFTLNSDAIAEQRNVKSSCGLHTTAGDIKGKCTLKIFIEGKYIMIQVIPSWRKSSEDDALMFLRLENNQSCKKWDGFNENGCKGEAWDGQE
ncbi:hypothetical protein [Nostoc parmelioides]|uniref:Uncharacterized protein n=1 Tax=Nostoc parmelioides FACHB-3921 TaxID=2692909 RepID=A0ABR8BMD3_9NOSO|nr:hypothetical protein [Nostoc parmelioides]MBD2255005.1 hypothetical protein [Nostoc parmelioides FACHB-3921]